MKVELIGGPHDGRILNMRSAPRVYFPSRRCAPKFQAEPVPRDTYLPVIEYEIEAQEVPLGFTFVGRYKK